MGTVLGCSCETKQDQEEISLMQPVSKGEGGHRGAAFAGHSMASPDESSLIGAADGMLQSE